MSSATSQRERTPRAHEIRALRDELDALANDMREKEIQGAGRLESIGPQARASACNLLHYLALRRHDLRKLQSRLTCVMLNKGPHICAAVAALEDILHRMQTHLTKKRSTKPRLSALSG